MLELFLIGIWIPYIATMVMIYLILRRLNALDKVFNPTKDLTKPQRVSIEDVITTEEYNYLRGLGSDTIDSFREDWIRYLSVVKNHMTLHEYIIRRKRERDALNLGTHDS